MQPDFKRAKEKSPEQLEEYFQYIKEEVDNGGYFKDALNWYMLRYVNPMVDRTIMAVVSIIAAISLYFLYQIISSAFPLVEEVPVVIRDYDMSLYRPMIREIRDSEAIEVKTVDESVSEYLLSLYVEDRESYDFRKAEVSAVNKKFTRVKNNSSYSEYKNFQLFMSRDNVNSPINNFGRNIYKTVKITGFEFIKEAPKDSYEKFKWFFSNRIPKEANVKFTATVYTPNEEGDMVPSEEKYLAKIKFNFAGLDRNAKSGVLNFEVNEYKLFKVK